jgi:hypothetical protein
VRRRQSLSLSLSETQHELGFDYPLTATRALFIIALASVPQSSLVFALSSDRRNMLVGSMPIDSDAVY